MFYKRAVSLAVLVMLLCVSMVFNSTTVWAGTITLKQGMKGSSVFVLQKNLKSLGYYKLVPTGYYGSYTTSAVKKLQQRYSLSKDGIAGKQTMSLIQRLKTKPTAKISRGSNDDIEIYRLPWFGSAEDIFKIGSVATVYDISSGLSFKAKRTYGYNHADCEPITDDDTHILKRIYSGQWSWDRRAVIVSVNGKKIAASIAGMPHAGVDSAPGGTYVTNRSGGYGAGTNLDAVKNNDMNGHFDIHFYGSRTHGTNRVNENHQAMVKKAAEWALRNY